ncbi:MAG: type II toxin-antitoxin system PemK/MazF family toxin [Pseudorhodoplanes sp.]
MKRGEVWNVAGDGQHAAIVMQDDRFAAMLTVTVCPLTRSSITSVYARPEIAPSAGNGLQKPARAMVDKVTTVPKTKLGKRLGILEAAEIARIEHALRAFLGMAA